MLELEELGDRANEIIFAECQRAIEEDRCGAIVLGCAGMAGLVDYLRARLPVPVIDGVVAAVKFAEALVGGGLRTSKHGDLAGPWSNATLAICRFTPLQPSTACANSDLKSTPPVDCERSTWDSICLR